jgi:hypothetical protein
VRTWTGRPTLKPLSPEGWFEEAHGIVGGLPDHNNMWMPIYGKGVKMFLLAPPPSIANVAWEELLKARHKRSDTFHVLLVPRIMTPRWRRLFSRPWCLKRAPLLLDIGRELRGVLETGEGTEGNLLRKLTLLPRRVDSLPFHMACGVLHMPGPGEVEVSDRGSQGW